MLADIQAALDERFGQLTGIDKAWPGVPYDPQVGVPYAKASLAGRVVDVGGLGANAPLFWRGAYQILIAWPTGEGLAPLHEMADVARALFPRGANLASGAANVIVERTTVAAPYATADWINLPVTVEWICEERP